MAAALTCTFAFQTRSTVQIGYNGRHFEKKLESQYLMTELSRLFGSERSAGVLLPSLFTFAEMQLGNARPMSALAVWQDWKSQLA